MRSKFFFLILISVISGFSFLNAASAFINYTNGNQINELLLEGNFVLWAASGGGGVRWDLADGSYKKYTKQDGLADNYVYAIAIDATGNKWFGTSGGVSKFDGTSWTTYTTADGLVSNSVRSIAIDAWGNKWFGTNGEGVSKFDGTRWTTYTTANGLYNNYVFCITIDAAGNVWFGTSGGMSKYDGTRWTNYYYDTYSYGLNYIFIVK